MVAGAVAIAVLTATTIGITVAWERAESNDLNVRTEQLAALASTLASTRTSLTAQAQRALALQAELRDSARQWAILKGQLVQSAAQLDQTSAQLRRAQDQLTQAQSQVSLAQARAARAQDRATQAQDRAARAQDRATQAQSQARQAQARARARPRARPARPRASSATPSSPSRPPRPTPLPASRAWRSASNPNSCLASSSLWRTPT